MPSNRERREYEEESTTTLRRKATDLAKAKWPTKVKIWIGIAGSTVTIIAFLLAGGAWFDGRYAHAEEVQRSQAQILLDLQQMVNSTRRAQVGHEIKDLDYREETDGPLDLDDKRDMRNLEGEQKQLQDQKMRLNAIEVEMKKTAK
jgi:hypothetical protein